MKTNLYKYTCSSRGFTMVEIMLVVIIIAALTAMVGPRLVGRSDQAKIAVARADIDTNIATGLKLYEMDNGNFPTTNQGLKALRTKPTGSPEARNWNGPYIEKDPVDPWDSEYMYVSPGRNNPDYDLYSLGKDPDSESDDVTNW